MDDAEQSVQKQETDDPDNDKIRIFVSHKQQDFQAAHQLKKILGERSGNQVKIFVSEQDIKGGDKWGEALKSVLQSSRLLILLYTNPTEDWDWCLYETGLFTPLKGDSSRRVICFHADSVDPPKPLKNLQTVPIVTSNPGEDVDENEVMQAQAARNTRLIDSFLEPFFLEDKLVGRAINPSLEPDQLSRIAVEIAALFAPQEIERHYPIKRLAIEYPDDAEFTQDQIAAESSVTTTNEDLAILGVGFKATTWANLVACMKEAGIDTHWTTELARQIFARHTGQAFLNKAIISTFRGADDNKSYRPVLYRIDIKNRKSFRFHVLFAEQYSAHILGDSAMPAAVFNLIHLANRMRADVIDRFTAELIGQSLAANELGTLLQRLQTALRFVEDEAAHLGYLLPEKVEELFELPHDKKTVVRLFAEWEGIRESLREAISKESMSGVKRQLEAMRQVNATFLVMASQRYAYLIKERYSAATRSTSLTAEEG